MDYAVIVIGAGAVGLAVAWEAAKRGYKTLIVEKNKSFGEETSSRNSEVIHAGIYYPAGSLKAQMCVNGSRTLYEMCAKYDIPVKQTGKYIIAINPEDLENMYDVKRKAEENGVEGVNECGVERLHKNEPSINAVGALFSERTGIIDSHKYMATLLNLAKDNDCDAAFSHEFLRAEKINGGYSCLIQSADGEQFTVNAEAVINCAGLHADKVAESFGINDKNLKLHYCIGRYFKIKSPQKFGIKTLIYPAPEKNYVGLGIHLTVDLDGGIKFGPDAAYLTDRELKYLVSDDLQDKFYQAAKRYVKNISPDDIYADYAGIRPKLQAAGGPQRDFYIREESARNLPGLINLIGIESPGLTSSLEIAKYTIGML